MEGVSETSTTDVVFIVMGIWMGVACIAAALYSWFAHCRDKFGGKY